MPNNLQKQRLLKGFDLQPRLVQVVKALGCRRVELLERPLQVGHRHQVVGLLLQPEGQVFRPLQVFFEEGVRVLEAQSSKDV